jgi:hypothetical protein
MVTILYVTIYACLNYNLMSKGESSAQFSVANYFKDFSAVSTKISNSFN